MGKFSLLRFALWAIAALAGLLGIDALLAFCGSLHPELRQDAAVWGTYGEWAVAILPPAGLFFGVAMWLRDSSERDALARDHLGTTVHLIRRDARVILINGSDRQIYVEDASLGKPFCVVGLGEKTLPVETTEVVFATIRGDRWKAWVDGASRQIPADAVDEVSSLRGWLRDFCRGRERGA